MALASLAHDETVLQWRGWGALVDACALALLVGLLATPIAHRGGDDAVLISALNPIFAIVLLGGAAPHAAERSALMRLVTSPAVAAAGKVSFHMYLLQEILAKLTLALQNYAYNKCTLTAPSACLEMELFHRGGIIQSEWWLPYLAALLGLANAWYDRVEAPWTGWLKGRLDQALPLADHVSADAAQSGAAKPPLL